MCYTGSDLRLGKAGLLQPYVIYLHRLRPSFVIARGSDQLLLRRASHYTAAATGMYGTQVNGQVKMS